MAQRLEFVTKWPKEHEPPEGFFAVENPEWPDHLLLAGEPEGVGKTITGDQ